VPGRKHLQFASLRTILSSYANRIPDSRQEGKVAHKVHDVIMSSFAMMFFQDPSLLYFQKRMEQERQTSNLKTLFGVASIPRDTCLREVVDEVSPDRLAPVFKEFLHCLQRGKKLESYRVLGHFYVACVDGSGYFSSDKICCPGCLTKRKGSPRFEHQIVQAALVHPGKRQVIPLCPEEVSNTDGADKQDCEISAGKRLIRNLRRDHPRLPLIIVGDSLYSKQPMIEALGTERMHYVLVAKEEDHKVLTEYVEGAKALQETSRSHATDPKGKVHRYEWVNGVPLNGNGDAPCVNWISYETYDGAKRTYHNAWVTDILITEKNIEMLARIGRCRWKIENETFNTLKNQGYHIDHSFGHGEMHLSFNFFLLNLLAFFFHQIFELTDSLYQACREKLGTKRSLWENLRVFLRIFVFPDWESLLRTVHTPSGFG
jgi:hypothetical protein